MKESCFNCAFRDKIKPHPKDTETKILCLYYDQWYKGSYHCSNWTDGRYNYSTEEKLLMVGQRKRRSSIKFYTIKSETDASFFVGVIIILIIILSIVIILASRCFH